MQKPEGKSLALRGLSPRAAALAVAFWIAVGVVAQATGLFDALGRVLTEPVELAARAALQQAPILDPKLKIIAFDDSTFARLRTPALSGRQWAAIVRALVAAKPRAIVTTHMFGGNEMQDDGGALVSALDDAKAAGVEVVAGVFAYPGAIRFREAVPTNNFSFIKPPDTGGAPRARNLRGYGLYGPEPAAVSHFARLGHQGYEGDGRAALMIEVADGVLVPHLALAVARNVRVTEAGVAADGVEVPLDRTGRTRIDLVPAAALAGRAKSLGALLQDAEADRAARYVEAGDVVLLLMDMYTGKVNFAATPQGPVPGGYLWAALLNSLLTQRWIREAGGAGAVILLAPAVGAAVGLVGEGWLFALGMLLLGFAISVAGLGSFAWRGVALPWMTALVLVSGAAGSLHTLKLRFRLRRERGRQIAADREAARLAAIVRTAQMFAHDVRKPFSLLNMALVAMKRETNPARAGALLASLAPELARAMATVEGMIKDIMEIDSDAELDLKEVNLGALVRQAMKDVIAVRARADVLVSFRLGHTLPAQVDAARLMRAVTNILDNAVQATGGKGRMWVDSEEVIENGRCFIRLCIGNGGSFIALEDRARVFDAFFTRGKKDGTGLGLAIAHKIVAGHGGRIWCDSAEGIGTEFFMTLPVADATPRPAEPESEIKVEAAALVAPAPVVAELGVGNRPVYAVIDDNAFILEAWEIVAQDEGILTFASPEAFLARIDADPALLGALAAVVTDYHFAGSSLDGVELARLIKERKVDFPVFLSTDGDVEYLPGDGIDARIAKEPTSFAELLRRRAGG